MKTAAARGTAGPVVIMLLALALLAAGGVGLPAAAHALVYDGDIPGVPMSPTFAGSLAWSGDSWDVFRVYLLAGETLSVAMNGPVGSDFDLRLYDPASISTAVGTVVASDTGLLYPATINHVAGVEGWHYLAINTHVSGGSGFYTVDAVRSWGAPQPPDTVERLWEPDRYSTSVAIAQKTFPGWTNLRHVVLASGEDRAAADPLAASGLSWTYGAPILLVNSDHVPSSVMSAMQAISSANGGVVIHVVGGEATIPDARLAEIAATLTGETIERIWPARNRFELAASIARRMDAERPMGFHEGSPGIRRALVANGADYDKFFDALALSPISANCGYPILLVEQDRIPSETAQVITDLGIGDMIVGGGPATVSNQVVADLPTVPWIADRWWGADRYETARVIAANAKSKPGMTIHYLESHNVGVAAKLPDALTGGAFAGLRNGPLLITPTDRLAPPTYSFLHNNSPQIGECYTLGGPASVTPQTNGEIQTALQP